VSLKLQENSLGLNFGFIDGREFGQKATQGKYVIRFQTEYNRLPDNINNLMYGLKVNKERLYYSCKCMNIWELSRIGRSKRAWLLTSSYLHFACSRIEGKNHPAHPRSHPPPYWQIFRSLALTPEPRSPKNSELYSSRPDWIVQNI